MSNANSSHENGIITSQICQGSTGLHQNNFKTVANQKEGAIIAAFRQFRDHCLLKLKDGMAKNANNEMGISKDDSISLQDNSTAENSKEIYLDDIPFYCKIVILSKLDTQDICNLSMASRHWSEVCSDQFLWRELLLRDILTWKSIGHKSHPLLSRQEFYNLVKNLPDQIDSKYFDEISFDIFRRLHFRKDVNFKALYFHCAYQRQQEKLFIGEIKDMASGQTDPQTDLNTPQSPQAQLNSNQTFPRFLKSLWMRIRSGNGEVIMLGPGMESPNTSKIFKRLLWARPDLLMTVRLLPSSQDGVGSGVELEFKGEKRFNLIALYSGNHRDRVKRTGLERLRESNILEENTAKNANKLPFFLDETSFKLREPVSNFLKQREDSYRLIYVVDATDGQNKTSLAYNRFELQAMLTSIREKDNIQTNQPNPDNPSALSSIMQKTGISSQSHIYHRCPVLVLCCVQTTDTKRIPCIEIATLLDLPSISDRPWHAQDVTVENLNGLENGLMWLFKQNSY